MKYLKWFYMVMTGLSVVGAVSLLLEGSLEFWGITAMVTYLVGAYLIESKKK